MKKHSERISQSYRNLRIRSKIVIVIVPLIALSIFLILLISDFVFSKSAEAQAETNVQDDCAVLVDHLNRIYDNVKTCSDLMTRDVNDIYQAKEARVGDSVSFVTVKYHIFSALDYDMRCFPEISSVVFTDIRGNIVQDGLTQDPSISSVDQNLLREIPKDGPPNLTVFPVGNRPYFAMSEQEPLLTIGKRIIDIQTGSTIGFIFINIKSSDISSVFPTDTSAQFYYVIDSGGRVIATQKGSGQKLLETTQDPRLRGSINDGATRVLTQKSDQGSFLVLEQPVESFQWCLVGQISLQETHRTLFVNTLITVIVGLTTMLLAAALVFYISRIITAPILQLTENVRRVRDGNLDVVCRVASNDEIGTLASGFNAMIRRVKELLLCVEQNEKRKQEYRLALVQSQIKPHFLYNALDLIYVLCKMGHTEKAATATKALADFYRISLSRGSEVIPVRDEIENVRNYLIIQQARFADIMQFRFEVAPEILDYSVLKLTLQPLVENAIYHGLKEKREAGTVAVRGGMGDDGIILEVEDDGVGMEPEQVKMLLQTDRQQNCHFGLRSVNERIRLYFGDRYGLRISSTPGKGTRVSVLLPNILWKEGDRLN